MISYSFCLFFFFAVCGPLAAAVSPVAEHRLWTRRPSGHGLRAQPLRGMWDLPGPGHKPVSPASAGGLSTTAPPGKHYAYILYIYPYFSLSLFLVENACIQQTKLLKYDLGLKNTWRASLVAQWLRVRLPMQGTRVRAPVREDPTCRGVAGPVSHGC